MKKINFKSSNVITTINIISTILLQGINFITLPIFTRLLGTSQFGIFSLFSSWISIVTCFMGFSVTSSLVIGMYDYKENYKKFRNSNLLFTTLICIIQVLIIVLFRKTICKIILLDELIVVFIALSSFGHYVLMFCQNSLTYEKRAIKNLIISLSYSLLSIFISLILINIVKENNRYYARIIGVTISYIIVSTIAWIDLYKECPTGIDKSYCKIGLKVGIPIIFHSLSLNILIQSDRVMMQIFNINSADIGIYSCFYSFCTVLTIIYTSLNNSWSPFYYDDLSCERIENLNKKCKNYIELGTVLGVGFLLLSREVTYIIADSTYWSGINLIPILVLAIYFTFIYQFPINYEFLKKKTKTIAIGTIIAAISNIGLNIVLIPTLGMYGAAISTMISYLILLFIHFVIIKTMNINLEHLKFKKFVLGIIVIVVAIILFYVLKDLWYIRWGLGFIIGCIEIYRIIKRKSIF